MLSEQEQRTFREIEQRIAADDPQFALAIRRLSVQRSAGRSGRGHDLVFVLATLTGLLCLVLALAGAAVALTVGFAGVTFVRLVGLICLEGNNPPQTPPALGGLSVPPNPPGDGPDGRRWWCWRSAAWRPRRSRRWRSG